MKQFVVFAVIISVAISLPIHEDAVVDVVSDNVGGYKYSFTSSNISITEERTVDGLVKGSYSYLDEDGEVQSVSYTAGVNGFVPVGTIVPVDQPEVLQARSAHLAISESLRSAFPSLKGAAIDDEEETVPLSNEELLEIVQKVANAGETAEVAEATNNFLKLYKAALEQH